MPELDAATYETIKKLCRQSDKLIKLGDYDRAVSKYYECITMLPRPVRSNKLAPWLYTALGEGYWLMHDYVEAGKAFGEAYCCPGCKENPQIVLRLGQCFAQCGEEKLAKEYLLNAIELGGEELLENEDKEYYYVLHPEERPVPEPEPVAEDFDKILGDVIAYPNGQKAEDIQPEDVELPVVVMQYDDADEDNAAKDNTEGFDSAADKNTAVPTDSRQNAGWFARGGKVVDIADESTPQTAESAVQNTSGAVESAASPKNERKPGFFERLLDMFKKKA